MATCKSKVNLNQTKPNKSVETAFEPRTEGGFPYEISASVCTKMNTGNCGKF